MLLVLPIQLSKSLIRGNKMRVLQYYFLSLAQQEPRALGHREPRSRLDTLPQAARTAAAVQLQVSPEVAKLLELAQ